MGYLIVFLGGGIGAALRHAFNLAFARLLGTAFPYATLFENVSGSIAMGMLVAFFAFKSGIPQHWQLFLTTGILGGYTTFSTFSLDVALLYERGELALAALCVAMSVALSIGGLFAGLVVVRNLI
ncbi:MAG TPA: fluoride efflux transporter CrcB [Pseudolabrys sp.]